ncbi:phytanoyl-CoA dioxygenase family protein [Desertibaculum subflavum]|uniref:phytanoyl-CoA dioxygenase family protein n=1 Tax=Desertibaculum subflavum TaxID=2268458 RepID=UPI000E669B8D
MRLNDQQMAAFESDGYVFLPGLFDAEEVGALMGEVPGILSQQRQEVVREKNSAPRTAFAAHLWNEAFGLLARHPRLIGPAMQMLGGPVYMHQFKINAKVAFDGDVWQWHQDYGTWAEDDLMPEPKAMNLAVYLDDVTEFNGPLMLIPGSHRHGKIEAGHDTATTSYPLWTIDNATIDQLVARGGIVAPKGKAGSALFFSSLLVHGSAPNMSPWNRTAVYISANRVDNAIRRFKRPEWIAHRDFTPITPLDDDCLRTYARRKVRAA